MRPPLRSAVDEDLDAVRDALALRCTAATTLRSSAVMRSMMSSTAHLVDAERGGVDGFSRQVLPLRVVRHASDGRHDRLRADAVTSALPADRGHRDARRAGSKSGATVTATPSTTRVGAPPPTPGRPSASGAPLRRPPISTISKSSAGMAPNTLEAYAAICARLAAFAERARPAGRGARPRGPRGRSSATSMVARPRRRVHGAARRRAARVLPVPAPRAARIAANPADDLRAPRALARRCRASSRSRRSTRCSPRPTSRRRAGCAIAR